MIKPCEHDTRIQRWGWAFKIEFGRPPEINPEVKYSFYAFTPFGASVGERVLVEGRMSWLVFQITDVKRCHDPNDLYEGHVILIEQHKKIGDIPGQGGVGEMMYEREKPEPKPESKPEPVTRPEPPEGEPLGKVVPSNPQVVVGAIKRGLHRVIGAIFFS